jgi:hypothetical protein
MRRKLLSYTLLVLLCSAGTASAVGEAGVPSLIIPPGARANGMGESFVAIADDATATWWNPGGVAFVQNRNLALMHSQLVPDLANDVYYEYLGFTNQVSNVGTLSLALVYLTYGKSQATDEIGNFLGNFNSWEASFILGFSMPLTQNIGFGINGKFIHVDLAPAELTPEKRDGSGQSVAFDAGLLWKMPGPRLNIGLALANLGPNISFVNQEQSDALPATLRFGAAWTPVSNEVSNWIVTGDIEQSLVWLISEQANTRRSEIYHVGTEYRYINLLAGRLGYIYDEDGDFSDPTYGLGFIYKNKVALDYANVPQAQTLDRVHRFSVTVSF